VEQEGIPVLPAIVPVVMPQLPARRVLQTPEELKAVSSKLRMGILGLIQSKPLTAKNIAEQLGSTPGAIGHHLHVLEAAGLAQIVGRRSIRNTVANYYARTAQIFVFDFPPELSGDNFIKKQAIDYVRDEIFATQKNEMQDSYWSDAFIHRRLSAEHAEKVKERVTQFVADMINEAEDDAGTVYSFFFLSFTAPEYLQGKSVTEAVDIQEHTGDPPCKE
jgi:DNA-binding transcriptional ArsR family regulator